MKYAFLFFFLSMFMSYGWTQSEETFDPIFISTEKKKTGVRIDEKGVLLANVSPKDLYKFKLRGWVQYSDFGATGDGKKDDIDFIAATHAIANQYGLTVKADDAATYYLSGKDRTVVVRTDTDFGKATFIIDDTQVQQREAPVFLVGSDLKSAKPAGITTLWKNQTKIKLSLPSDWLILVTNSKIKRFIRYGLNQNNGASQSDVFIVDEEGNVDMNAPIIWDFEQITDLTALPIDEKTLTISGGRFITIANQEASNYRYFSRNISIRRSHVLVKDLEHRITGEGAHGAPYNGFLNIADCAHVTVRDAVLTGHKTYVTMGAAGKPVSMGSYDIVVNRAIHVSFINCKQTNDINDKTYWGIMGSNYSKNLLYDSCTFSRFDAHMGVANATIRNSTLGHMGINAIGNGVLRVENTTIFGNSLINLRSDYGSTWQGDVLIRNCVFVPSGGKPVNSSLIGGSNSGQHDFGYICYMPERITMENLRIEDSHHPEYYEGPAIFSNFNPDLMDATYQETYPFVRTKEVILRNVTTASGLKLRICDNPFLFKDVKVLIN
jgi:hypothetical protein